MFVAQVHTQNLIAVKGQPRILPKNGTAEVSVNGEPSLGVCKLELEKHVLRVSENRFGGKIYLCLNFDLYTYGLNLNDDQIVIKTSEDTPTLVMLNIEPANQV